MFHWSPCPNGQDGPQKRKARSDDVGPCRQPELHALTQVTCSYVLLLTALPGEPHAENKNLLALITHLNHTAAVVAPGRTLAPSHTASQCATWITIYTCVPELVLTYCGGSFL